MARHRILMVAPELAPLVKVGGLADVTGSLSKELSARGHDVRIILPKYRGLMGIETARPLEPPLVVQLGGKPGYGRLWEMELPGSEARVYLIEHEGYFDTPNPYLGPSGDPADSAWRFAFLARAAIDLCAHRGWYPEVFHCHDWPSALVPLYLNTRERGTPLESSASVLTLHNMQHQGSFAKALVDFAGLPQDTFRDDCLEANGRANMLKGGIFNATKITTVSPTYAKEIQRPSGGHGLDALLRFRAPDLIGVLNGIDPVEWNPSTDPLLPARFSVRDRTGKAVCKAALQGEFGLEAKAGTPVFAVVSRLVDQKGYELLIQVADDIMNGMQVQLAVLGSGDPALERAFRALARRHPGRVGVKIGYDHALSHRTFAGADFLVMPSHFEPCGLSQIYAMLYGCLPIVRSTGGLIDTVRQYDQATGEGTGFRFDAPSSAALHDTIGWACATYYDRPQHIQKLQANGMRQDFSWERSAAVYEDVFDWAVEARHAGLPSAT